jgi:hypothetical protein
MVGLDGGSVTMRKVLEYEQRAATCRQKAAETKNVELKKQLEEAAELWERLAREQRQGVTANEPNSR